MMHLLGSTRARHRTQYHHPARPPCTPNHPTQPVLRARLLHALPPAAKRSALLPTPRARRFATGQLGQQTNPNPNGQLGQRRILLPTLRLPDAAVRCQTAAAEDEAGLRKGSRRHVLRVAGGRQITLCCARPNVHGNTGMPSGLKCWPCAVLLLHLLAGSDLLQVPPSSPRSGRSSLRRCCRARMY